MADAETTAAKDYKVDVPMPNEPFFLRGSNNLDWGMKNRLANIFDATSGRTVMLAFDHGYFLGPTSGLERVDLDIVPLIPYADTLMLTRGILRTTIPPTYTRGIVLRASGGPSILREVSDEQLDARVQLQGLFKAFMETDCSLAEINPLILTGSGKVIALDAKFNFDANSLFRQPEIVAYRDLDEEDPAEIEASKFDLAYISLDGNIGCLVNGAGLAMATMDTIKLFGGEPANFLDVGGGATAEKVTEAFKIMLKNPGLKAILVNIFGGIMRCDVIAEGVITASKAVSLQVPLVVRMKGTNEDIGKKMLADSGLPIISADTMEEAAQKVVAAAAQA